MASVLLVDDQPNVVRLLEMALRDQGLTLFTAHDGLRALELVRQERPDLVLLDVVMPELDGIRVLNRIKTSPELKETIVVMLTAQDQPEDVLLGLDVGADYYLAKPFHPADIGALVRRILSTDFPPAVPVAIA